MKSESLFDVPKPLRHALDVLAVILRFHHVRRLIVRDRPREREKITRVLLPVLYPSGIDRDIFQLEAEFRIVRRARSAQKAIVARHRPQDIDDCGICEYPAAPLGIFKKQPADVLLALRVINPVCLGYGICRTVIRQLRIVDRFFEYEIRDVVPRPCIPRKSVPVHPAESIDFQNRQRARENRRLLRHADIRRIGAQRLRPVQIRLPHRRVPHGNLIHEIVHVRVQPRARLLQFPRLRFFDVRVLIQRLYGIRLCGKEGRQLRSAEIHEIHVVVFVQARLFVERPADLLQKFPKRAASESKFGREIIEHVYFVRVVRVVVSESKPRRDDVVPRRFVPYPRLAKLQRPLDDLFICPRLQGIIVRLTIDCKSGFLSNANVSPMQVIAITIFVFKYVRPR